MAPVPQFQPDLGIGIGMDSIGQFDRVIPFGLAEFRLVAMANSGDLFHCADPAYLFRSEKRAGKKDCA